jgi:hypothetical protein
METSMPFFHADIGRWLASNSDMGRRRWSLALLTVVVGLTPTAALAQGGAATSQPVFWPRPIVEGIAGYTGFVDEDFVDHTIFGGSARFYVLQRVAIGPEIVYMRGPDDDRDLFLTGNASIDLLPELGAVRRTVTPFLTVGGGLMRHTGSTGAGSQTIWEGALTAGGGARIALGDRFFIAPELRVGWEPHLRISVAFGTR